MQLRSTHFCFIGMWHSSLACVSLNQVKPRARLLGWTLLGFSSHVGFASSGCLLALLLSEL